MLPIQKKLTLINRTIANSRKIKYIVIHYVGAVSSAKANVDYFYSVNRNASAHYFVDETEIWQGVDDSNIAWHCGSNKYYNDCRNQNSIGIEMCCKKDANGKWYFEEQTVKNTIELVRYLMKLHGVTIDCIIRHYDVTHKVCPEPYVRDEEAWQEFKKKVGADMEKVTDIKEALDILVEKGRMTDRPYWEKAILTTRNVDFLIIKYANDLKTLAE